MKQILLLSAILLPICAFSQLNESFSGPGVTTHNPWKGDTSLFAIHKSGCLWFVSPEGEAGSASLYIPLAYAENMSWEMDVKLDFNSTNANNLRIFVYEPDTIYIQAGNNNRQISLYQKDTQRTNLRISGRKALLDEPYAYVSIRLTLENGNLWTLYTRRTGETSFYKEGTYKMPAPPADPQALMILTCRYIKGRISEYFVDNLKVSHEITDTPDPDPDPEEETGEPNLLNVEAEDAYTWRFFFDRPLDISEAICEIEGVGEATISYGENQSILLIGSPEPLEDGREYYVVLEGLADPEGNRYPEQTWAITHEREGEGEPEKPEDTEPEPVETRDIVFNELLPNPFAGGSEYIELYNRSDRTLSLKDLAIATRKSDGRLNTAYPLSSIPVLMESGSYVLVTTNKEGVAAFYTLSSPGALYELKIPVLSNTSSTLVLFRREDETVIDEVPYSSHWHDVSVKDQKGVALERINPDALSESAANWTSAASVAGYGTPGYRNSQYLNEKEETPTGISAPSWRPDGLYGITYYLETTGYRCRIRVYDMAGRQVAEIANHELMGVRGELIWDGKSAGGSRLPTGVYIFYAELYNSAKGTVTYEKRVFLVR
jgi:hypothetical protein